ncbi:MAG: family 20 glycosylhydrolase [Prevotella sp.]|nr:family 20 glycosylhydrolase [Prevotella sp.]
MKRSYLILFLLIISIYSNSQAQDNSIPPLSLVWEMGANEIEPGCFENTFKIVNHSNIPLDNNWIIYFNLKPVIPIMDKSYPLVVGRIGATYYKMYPSSQYRAILPNDTLSLTFRCKGSLIKQTAAPEGAYLIKLTKDGKQTQPITLNIKTIPFTYEAQWSRTNANELPYPVGNRVYDENELFTNKITLSKTDIFPSIKSVKVNNDSFHFTKSISLNYDPVFSNEAEILTDKLVSLYGCAISAKGSVKINLVKTLASNENKEEYQLIFNNGTIDIKGETPHSIFNGIQTLFAIIGTNNPFSELSNMEITDYPDLPHRGLMLDVARNFTTKATVFKLIDLLSMYKMNVLHLHLTDDEGWRLEIPGIEELTDVGSRRGHTLDERECLYPAYGGGWNPNDATSTANGYYTRNDFIKILKYAKKRHIKIVPEIDLPGHARAALKAMNTRYYKYIDNDKEKATEYLLSDFADTSRYISAQSFNDNVINVALPSTYRFVEKIVTELDMMYYDAGSKLDILHLGGDEVPQGAWKGSPIANAFMGKNDIKELRDLKDYFIERTIKILKEKKIQSGAWQEVALLPNKTANKRFANENVLSYCWSTIPEWKSDQIPYNLANAGYPVVLCNISNFYFDLSYNKHQEEPGAYWAGFVNEYNSFDMLPYNIYRSVRHTLKGEPIDTRKTSLEKVPLAENNRKEIKGIQGQLWSETIRNSGMIEYSLFPKMFGLIERAWNTQPKWGQTDDETLYKEAITLYNAKITQHEMPRLSASDVNYRIPQPGIKIMEGKLYVNSSVDGAEIRYTTDGSEPAKTSTKWEKPVEFKAKSVKAKTFFKNKESVTSRLENLP